MTGSDDIPRTESMPGDGQCISSAALRARSKSRQVSVDSAEEEHRRLEGLVKQEEEGDRTSRGNQGVEASAKREAKKDAMGQPIHDEDSSQDELMGKGSSSP